MMKHFCKSLCPPVFEFRFLKVSRLDVAKWKNIRGQAAGSMDRTFGKSWTFPKYWRWWGVQASKFMKFVRWRDFNALRRAHVSFTWLVEWLHPKSNSVYRGNCSTKGGRLIRRFSNFDHDFRGRKWCIMKIPSIRLVGPCMNFIFWKYHGWTLRNKKNIRDQAAGSMDRKFGKSWNFPIYWRWWRVQASKFIKFGRWRDFNALRRAHVLFTWIVKWLHP